MSRFDRLFYFDKLKVRIIITFGLCLNDYFGTSMIKRLKRLKGSETNKEHKQGERRCSILDIYRSQNTVFTTKDISLIWQETDLNTIKARINYYVKKGKLYAIRRGIYARDRNYNKFELATKIYTPSYISLETVLQREGIIFQYYKAIYVISYLSREIFCDGQKYIFRKIKNEVLVNNLGIKRKENYFIALKERAFLDALYLYKDYHFDNLKPLNWDFCFEIAPIYKNKKLIKALKSYARY